MNYDNSSQMDINYWEVQPVKTIASHQLEESSTDQIHHLCTVFELFPGNFHQRNWNLLKCTIFPKLDYVGVFQFI